MKPRRLSKKYGLWADPWMRPKTWTPEAAALAIEITKQKIAQEEARRQARREQREMDRARTVRQGQGAV